MERWSPIVELRRYTLHPGRRDALIDLFEAELVETQEAVGMKVIGSFRDLDDPDRFVWLRGFETMDARARGLDLFYGGPIWARHRDAANATMIDSDDVLLLRPAAPAGGFALPEAPPPREAPEDSARGLVEALVLELEAPAGAELVERLSESFSRRLADARGIPLACFVGEEGENTYPRLPVRAGVHPFVFFSGYPRRDHPGIGRAGRDALVHIAGAHASQLLRLLPTRRSRLAGAVPAEGDVQ